MLLVFLFISVCFLAYSNGANDNFKGVATLLGTGTSTYKTAIRWATVTTFLGSVAALFLAGKLISNFSGKGLVPDEYILDTGFAMAISLGAGLTVLMATQIGMPISTTHALVGGLFGAGVMAVGSAFNFNKLGSVFLFPLVVSPLIASLSSFILYLIFKRLRAYLNLNKKTCLYIKGEFIAPKKFILERSSLKISGDRSGEYCGDAKSNRVEIYRGKLLEINSQKLLDISHFISAGVVSFSRGLNDTPKMLGLLIVIKSLNIEYGMIAIAIAIALGGLFNASRVGLTISKKITTMNHGQGFTANLITGILVTTASIHGLPVSTTHVSVGAIFGIGTANKKADLKVIRKILLSWILTLPVAGILSAIIYFMIN